MKINIYYGGRGLVDDPSLFVINKMQEVLEELNVKVERFMLAEMRNNITTLPQTLKSADGIILATTVEWYGIGGYLQTFLDACWLYGDKEKISTIYMCPIVMSTTYGERDASLNLTVAWEILGGKPCSGICGYISDTAMLENNKNYIGIIERKAENMYRTINQKVACFPASNQAVNQTVAVNKNINLTPQESEQLSQYVADETYVQTQKEDIRELASYFKGMMDRDENEDEKLLEEFRAHFKPRPDCKVFYKIVIEDKQLPLIINVNNAELECEFSEKDGEEVLISTDMATITEISQGRMSFQRAFMSTGNMKVKGDFKLLRMLDQLFVFMEG
ncbi:MAG: SCP2 sterol-binding domain-containing protein [Lachnospiraceae bacterium]|nr:SCP2 sterol-binding domain-containing protein [Lachnospiraceae bacterium]